MRGRITLLALCLGSASVLACSDATEPEPQPPKTYPHGTPEQLVQSFVWSYEDQDIAEYSKLFTGDFTFEFSNAADPNLVQLYSMGWFKDDETIAAANLFNGGLNSDGIYQDEATQISLGLPDSIPVPDTTRADTAYAYRVVLSPAVLTVTLAGPDLIFAIGASPPQPQRIFLVRGDFAETLAPEQPADSSHWYIYRWQDEAPPLRRGGPVMNESATWGRIKGVYR